ncbi:MAG: GDSL-type esterase/lipase family protein [Maribacter sp.]
MKSYVSLICAFCAAASIFAQNIIQLPHDATGAQKWGGEEKKYISYSFILQFICILFLVALSHVEVKAQTGSVFEEEVASLTKKYDTIWDNERETILFTGSSSVRFWKTLEESFPNHQILNTGFGGSQASDLLYHLDDLVLRYKPRKVFIYEGDNDIFSKKKPKDILKTTSDIILQIRNNNPNTKIVLISAKPSISRWRLRGRYKRLNKKYLTLSEQDPFLEFIDVWNPMLNGRKLKKDIFIEDGLHMNQKGYDLWYEAMKDQVNKP